MSESSKKANPDLAPLTIGHGRKLFDQNKEIATLLGQMRPLLALIEEKGAEPAVDPIAQIVNLLTTIVTTQLRQDQHQQVLGKKLDFIIARLTAAGQFGGSAE
jgi:hypothetical protein